MKGKACLLSLLVSFGAELQASSPPSAVKVKLQNGTSGAAVPTGALVRLETLRGEEKLTEQEAWSSAAGEAVFSIPAEPDLAFRATVSYKDATYPSELVYSPSLDPIEVTVFEATEEPSDLLVTVGHMLFEAEGQSVKVTEMALVANTGDRAYVGKPVGDGSTRQTLQFTLPTGAFEVEPGEGLMSCCIHLQGQVLSDSMPVLPGRKQIGFSYRLPLPRGGLELERSLDLPGQEMLMVAENATLEPLSQNLSPLEAPVASAKREPSERTMLVGRSLRAGDVLRVRLDGLPGAPLLHPIAMSLLAGAALLGVSGVLLLFRNRKVSGASGTSKSLAQAIAELDRKFDAGEIDRASYESERAARKERLVRLLDLEDEVSPWK